MFEDMIVEMFSKKIKAVVPELFIKSRKIKDSLVFISQSYFDVEKNIGLNSTYYFNMKIQNKREFQQIAINHLSYISFKDYANLFKDVPQNRILY